MSMSRKFWVTGATNGLGLALVEHILERGDRVAASARAPQAFEKVAERLEGRELRLPGQLQNAEGAAKAASELQRQWGALDTLIINAGTCDYLPADLQPADLFTDIVNSNLRASEHCLTCALPLLAKGRSPQVVAILSRYSALQLHEPTQPLTARNSLPHWFREQRQTLKSQGIELSIVAPQSLKAPVTPIQVLPQRWSPDSAAEAILQRLPEHHHELVLEALDLNSLWPLPQ
ncbi:SDR family NAD(P)-dependent oxidoreductase [Pseudomonas sp. X10]